MFPPERRQGVVSAVFINVMNGSTFELPEILHGALSSGRNPQGLALRWQRSLVGPATITARRIRVSARLGLRLDELLLVRWEASNSMTT